MRPPPANQDVFDQLLDKALKGEPPWTEYGMNTATFKALRDVARAYPNASAPLIALAKQRFAEQLSRNAAPTS